MKLYYESPQDVPAPYHLEAKIEWLAVEADFSKIQVDVQYVDREDFSKEELQAEGLNPENHWTWKGDLPKVWHSILKDKFSEYKQGEASPKSSEPFIGLEKGTQVYKPKDKLDIEDEFIQEFLQAIFELAEMELPLYLGFQFCNSKDQWLKVEGELSFANRAFNYIEDGNENKVKNASFDEIKYLMGELFIGEFLMDKGAEELKNKQSFAVFPGDGLWYVAGNSWKKPNGNHHYFDKLEATLQKLF